MQYSLEDKVAMVTASSAGIGLSIVRRFLQAGASVAMCARDEGHLEAAKRSVSVTGSDRVFSLAGDIGDPEFLHSFVSESAKRFGNRLDILVNNSGGPPPGEALAKTDAEWKAALDNNFLSVVRMCRLVVPYMKEQGWGRIINLTSTAAREPAAGMVLSNATRAAVASYSKTLAQELGPFGITVNTILTGGVLTDRLNSLLAKKVEGTDQTIEDAIVEIEKTIPVRHIATPDEFAQTILFLASPAASYLSGAAIPLDGGTSKSVF